MTVKERIMQYIALKGLSVRAIEIQSGLSNGYLHKTVSVSGESCAKILAAFPELSAEWLMRGKGNMIVVDQPKLDILNSLNEHYNDNEVMMALIQQVSKLIDENRELRLQKK